MVGDPNGNQTGAQSLDEQLFGSAAAAAGSEQPAADHKGETLRFAYRDTHWAMTGLAAKNALLNLVTLTLYRFWGRTHVRQKLLATTDINDEPLEYLGTGWELFRGFLIALFGFFLPFTILILAVQFTTGAAQGIAVLVLVALYLGLIFLIPYAVYSSRRYRFSRSAWRGIRFAMDGSAAGFAWASIGYGLLNGLTWGWYAPASDMRLTRRLWSETKWGSKRFKILLPDAGLAGPVYGAFALFWFSIVVCYIGFGVAITVLAATGVIEAETPGIGQVLMIYGIGIPIFLIAFLAWIPYQAALMRRKAEMIGLDHATFRIDANFGSLLWLYVGNGLIFVLTLGLGEPLASARTFRYVFNRLKSKGAVDLDAIAQARADGTKSGEGLADAFDIGGF
jgi:uncharacterized membrane protein YjgN (DUF898 family)